MAAAEARDPRRNIPKAIKRIYFRVLVLYIGSVFIIGLLVPSNDQSLNSTFPWERSVSPFVTAFQEAGMTAAPAVRYEPERPVSLQAMTLFIDHKRCHSGLCMVCWFR